MPRLARLDAPGVLHHVIIRGIERRNIFECEIPCSLLRSSSKLARNCSITGPLKIISNLLTYGTHRA